MRSLTTWQRLPSTWKIIIPAAAAILAGITFYNLKLGGLVAFSAFQGESSIPAWHIFGYSLSASTKISALISGLVFGTLCLAIPTVSEKTFTVWYTKPFLAFVKLSRRNLALRMLLWALIFVLASVPVFSCLTYFSIALGKISSVSRGLLLVLVLSGVTAKHFVFGKFLELLAPFGGMRMQFYLSLGIVFALIILVFTFFLWNRWFPKVEVAQCDAIDA